MEESGALRAQQQTGQVGLPGVTGNILAPTASNNNGAALASASVNVMGAQDTLPSSSQATAATTRNFVYEGASIAPEHVERNAVVKLLQLHHVGGMNGPLCYYTRPSRRVNVPFTSGFGAVLALFLFVVSSFFALLDDC